MAFLTRKSRLPVPPTPRACTSSIGPPATVATATQQPLPVTGGEFEASVDCIQGPVVLDEGFITTEQIGRYTVKTQRLPVTGPGTRPVMQRYKVMKVLGDGTFGTVSLAKCTDGGELVAIKK